MSIRSHNYGPELLLASSEFALKAVVFYRIGSNVHLPSYGTSAPSMPGFTKANGYFYLAVDDATANTWTIYRLDLSEDDPAEELVCLDGIDFSSISRGLQVDSSENCYICDNTVSRVNSSGVVWGPHSVNVSDVHTDQARHIRVYDDRLFVAGKGENSGRYPHLFEVDIVDSTDNANGSRLCIQAGETGDMVYYGDMGVDTTNGRVAYTYRYGLNTRYQYIKVYDVDETGTTEVAEVPIYLQADEAFTKENYGKFLHWDAANDQWIYCFHTDGTVSAIHVCAFDYSGMNLAKTCTTLGDLYDSCIDSAGNIYLLCQQDASTKSGEIIKMNSSMVVQWQVEISDYNGNLLYPRAIDFDEESQCLIVLMQVDAAQDYVVLFMLPAGTGTGQFIYSVASGPDNEIYIDAMSADTWSASSTTIGAENPAAGTQPTTMALNNNTDGDTDTNNVLTETVTG